MEEIYYYPFGGTRTDTGSISINHKYTSQELDGETGLYYYGARYYNPQLGRFVSPDSIIPDPFDPQAFNRYSYVINNPLVYVDPNGHFLAELITAVIVAAVSYFVDSQGGNVEIGGGGSINSEGNTDYWTGTPSSGEIYSGGSGGGYNPSEEYYYEETIGSQGFIAFCCFVSYGYSGSSNYAYNSRDYIYDYGKPSSYDNGWFSGTSQNLRARGGSGRSGESGGGGSGSSGSGGGGSGGGTFTSDGVTYNYQGILIGEAGLESNLLDEPSMFFIGGGLGNFGRVGKVGIAGFTKHGINQAISRDGAGVSSKAMLDAIKNSLKVVPQSGGKIMYVGKDATVILNAEGKVITTWPRSRAGWRNIHGGQ